MIESMCRHWYDAEKRETDVAYDLLTQARRDEVRKRVVLVLSGEVRYSECSSGDLRIWNGRARDRDWWEQMRRVDHENFLAIKEHTEAAEKKTGGPRLHRYRERRWAKIYDTLTGPDSGGYQGGVVQSSTNLFGNRNVGNYNLTNLQIAGQLASDQTFYARSWHATVPFDKDVLDETNDLLRHTMITLVVGDRPQQEQRLVDLVGGIEVAHIIIPVRQNFGATVWISANKALQSLNEKLRRRDPERAKWGIVVNIEGARTRDVA